MVSYQSYEKHYNDIIKLYQQGLRIVDIANKYHAIPVTISAIIRKTIGLRKFKSKYSQYYDDIKKLYQKGLQIVEISKKYNIGQAAITDIIRKTIGLREIKYSPGIISKHHPPGYWDLEYPNMAKLYRNGLSSYEIGKLYHIGGESISVILISRGIKLRSKSEANSLRRKKEKSGMYSLTKIQWKQIQKKYKNGKSLKKLSIEYGIDKRGIKKIVMKKCKLRSWKEAQKLGTPKKEQAWNWIEDRTKLKNRRWFVEEQDFCHNVLKKRNYICELTGKNGTLSVHHIVPVRKNKDLQLVESNVIVVLRSIHQKFHKLYGNKRCTEFDWYKFVANKEYVL